jgi:hypothetical protein
LYLVACPSVSQCTGLDSLGQIENFDPASPGVPTPNQIETRESLTSLACPSANLCVAVDGAGNVLEGDPTTSAAWSVTPIKGVVALTSVACPTTVECVAADAAGREVTGTGSGAPAPPTNVAPATIVGAPTEGQQLAAQPGTWSGSPTGYSYQWQDCDGAGANCVAISGATAVTYTLGPGDVGHTVRVLETAANAGGPGAGALSAPTAVVASLPPATTPTSPTTTPTPTPTPGPGVSTTPIAPNTLLASTRLNDKKHTAEFHLETTGSGTGFECAIVRVPSGRHKRTPAPHYGPCHGTVTFDHLAKGHYLLYARAVGPGGADATPVVHRFRIT